MRGGGREDDSKHDQIEFLFALAHGRNIDRRKAAGIARKEKKRERESGGRLKARRSFIEWVKIGIPDPPRIISRKSRISPFLPPSLFLPLPISTP